MGALGAREPVRGRAASSGGAGAGPRAGGSGGGGAGLRADGLGRTEAAPLLLGALSVRAAHPAVSASPAAAAWRCGGRDTETETAAAGPASGLGLAAAPRPRAPPRPGFSGSAWPRPAAEIPPRGGAGSASSPGRRARAGRAAGARAGPGWARGGSALWGPALGPRGAGPRREDVGGGVGSRVQVGSRSPSPSPSLGKCQPSHRSSPRSFCRGKFTMIPSPSREAPFGFSAHILFERMFCAQTERITANMLVTINVTEAPWRT